MASHNAQGADDGQITLDLRDIFTDNSENFAELTSTKCRDNVLMEFLNDLDEGSFENNKQSDTKIKEDAIADEAQRFVKLTKEEIDKIAEKTVKEKTIKQTHWGVKIFQAWLQFEGCDTEFEQMSKTVSADTLREFYPSVRQQPPKKKKLAPGEKQPDPKPYAKQSLINIQSAINCHLQLPPYNRTWDLMTDREFLPANKVFKGNLCKQKEEGFDKSTHYPPVTKAHVQQIYQNYFEPHFDNDPYYKVYFDIAFFLGKRGQEGLRELNKISFTIHDTDDNKQ